MTNPTSNYSFQMPTATDLVTDLPADFEVFGQAVDTRLKALQPGTTLGDLAYSSATANTNTRLPIGSTGNILTVAGGVPTWAAPSGGGLTWTLLNTGGTSLSGSSVTVSGITTENILVILLNASSASASSEVRMRLNSDSTAKYSYGGVFGVNPTTYIATASQGQASINNTYVPLGTMDDGASSVVSGAFTVNGGKSTGSKSFSTLAGGENYGSNGQRTNCVTGIYAATAALSSVTVLSTSGSFDGGTIYVYGA